MKSEQVAGNGDMVIVVATSWQGHEVFTREHRVDKTYKNGNVVLTGIKGQFYHTPTDDGYKLSQCSGSMQLVKLTPDVRLRIEKSKSIQDLFAAYHSLEKGFMKNRRFISRLNTDDINRIKQSFDDASTLIKDCKND